MNWTSAKRLALGMAALVGASAIAPVAQAQDFFSALFGGFGRSRGPSIHLPFVNEGGPFAPGDARPRYSGGGQAYCVRTSDEGHFPINAADNQSRAASRTSFVAERALSNVYGSSINAAATETGKPYSE